MSSLMRAILLLLLVCDAGWVRQKKGAAGGNTVGWARHWCMPLASLLDDLVYLLRREDRQM